MDREAVEEQMKLWAEEHPWISDLFGEDDDNVVDEVIRYTLDEIRIA